ncbi:PREDICTED: protein FAM71E1-like [Gekko japonicus]|uniref:Protein FAM71E1-like n=1 Tax=Gekko japonicus TaxID=146911 RepID=A0ABM1JTA7_GEKJA|nr:PREDICTED: protein FAM71E1-like [Gekko japonicus]
MGDLQKCLAGGEYDELKDCPLYESNFVQVTRSGEVANRVTVGIAASSRSLELPDLMLLARPEKYGERGHTFLLPTRLLPLKFVRISIHDRTRYQLKVRLASGRLFYLQLLVRPPELDNVFGQWIRLLYCLHVCQPAFLSYPHRAVTRRSSYASCSFPPQESKILNEDPFLVRCRSP